MIPLAMLLADDGFIKLGIGNGDRTAGGFADAALVTAAFELRGKKRIDHLDRRRRIDVFSGKAEHVGIVVLAGSDGLLDIADIRGADVVKTVRGDAHSHT